MAALIALTVHEYCHGYAAYKLGDTTARNLGRLTLNPTKHLDPIGTLCMVLFHVGWAKPVPVNPRNFKNPKRDFAITAVAGPISNLLLGFISAGLYLLLFALFKDLTFTSKNLAYNLVNYSLTFVYIFHTLNIGLGIFNLLPIPPFDGSRLLNVILPERAYFAVMKYERQIYLVVIAWLLLGDMVASGLRMIPIISATPWLNTIVGIFSLSDILSYAISAISNLTLSFWQIIPFLKI